jgi:outer membrane lipoprotein
MKTARLLPSAVFLLSLVLAAGCAAPFSKGLLGQADKSATVDKVIASPSSYGNTLVVWGGRIITTTPRQSATSVEVSDRPLDYQKRPKDLSLSRGRFIARFNGFLDPSVFCRGKDFTVVGRVTGTETGRIGEYQYTYPVVAVEEYYLWAPQPAYYYYPYPYYYPFSAYYEPWGYYY